MLYIFEVFVLIVVLGLTGK